MAAAAAATARDAQTSLALRLVKHLASDGATGGGNVAFSPVSVYAALALLAAGARGATLAELLAFLGVRARRVRAQRLADRSDSGGRRVLFGGGLWVEASSGGLADAFRNVAAESSRLEAHTVSFVNKPVEAVTMINEWVKKVTNGLIETIITTDDINEETHFVLANAVYFKGKWLEPFESNDTRRRAFHCLDGSRTMPETMSMRKRLQIACMDGFKALKLPYEAGERRSAQCQPKRHRGLSGAASAKATDSPDADGDTEYSMLIFLPDTRDGIATMVDVITAASAFLYSTVAEMKVEHVDLQLPKFEITFGWVNLEDTLRGLGLSLPFSQKAADLRGMFKDDDVAGSPRQQRFVGKAAHKAIDKVDEEGTEAAASTMCMAPTCPPRWVPRQPLEFFADGAVWSNCVRGARPGPNQMIGVTRTSKCKS